MNLLIFFSNHYQVYSLIVLPDKSLVQSGWKLYLFSRTGNWSPERLTNLYKVTYQVNDRDKTMNLSLFNHSLIHFVLTYLWSNSWLSIIIYSGYSLLIKTRSLPVRGIRSGGSDGLVKEQLLNWSALPAAQPCCV